MISDLAAIIGMGILAGLVLGIARRRGFFSPDTFEPWNFPIRWYQVIGVFVVYFGLVAEALPFLASIFRKSETPFSQVGIASWLNFLTSASIAALLLVYLFCIPRDVVKNIWRRSGSTSYRKDFAFAAIAWVISFPLVIFFNQLFDFALHNLFHISILPDQLAVRFLKMTFQDPFYMLLTVTTIVILAPLIEETMFRGFLQSFIRQHLGSKSAIFITAVCFSLFHYSPEQGLANISIIGSLFVLSCFLGFTYERRGSLMSSIALHSYFNAINVVNLYFLGGFPISPL